MSTVFLTVQDILKEARAQQTRIDFATRLGIEPYALSRYESGKVAPPPTVLNACLAILAAQTTAPSANELAEFIKTHLDGPREQLARSAVMTLLKGYVKQNAVPSAQQ